VSELGDDEAVVLAPTPKSFTKPLAVAAVAAIVVVIGLFVLSAHQKPVQSGYPELRNAVGYGKFTGFTPNDAIFYLTCVRSYPDDHLVAAGFWKIPTSHLTFRVTEPTGRHGAAVLKKVSFSQFIIANRHHHFVGDVYVTPTRRLVSNGLGPNVCAGDIH
jgi:hypothetical protein